MATSSFSAAPRDSGSLRGSRWVVAGAGVFGAAIAWRLAAAGAAVTLCDPAASGDNASGVAAGMLAPAFETVLDPDTGLDFSELAAARDLWPAFAATLDIPVDRAGALWVGEDAGKVAERLRAIGAACEELDGAEAARRAPGLAGDITTAVFTPEDWRVDAPSALARILALALEGGATRVTAAVTEFADGRTVLSNGQTLDADGLIVATGAGAASGQRLLAPELGVLRPIKGQIVRSQAGPRSGPVVRAAGVYVGPGEQGAFVGATMQAGLDDRRVEPAAVERLLQLGGRLFPGIAEAKHAAAAAVRAATPDGAPLIGASSTPGVLIAAGARRNGWLLAPLAAELILRLASGDSTPVAPFASDHFDPGRFAAGRS